MKQLGKLEKIEDLRSIWKHEAKDFTPWLAEEENLSILSEADDKAGYRTMRVFSIDLQ